MIWKESDFVVGLISAAPVRLDPLKPKINMCVLPTVLIIFLLILIVRI